VLFVDVVSLVDVESDFELESPLSDFEPDSLFSDFEPDSLFSDFELDSFLSDFSERLLEPPPLCPASVDDFLA
jgi:hypothetical protein